MFMAWSTADLLDAGRHSRSKPGKFGDHIPDRASLAA
jgi:hypothetical protein